jgi:hypothetical protein
MQRDFKGVWISREIYLHEGLTPTEKLLLAEIDSFSKNGQCYASNDHFARFLCISKNHVSKLISKLVKMGLVNVYLIYKQGTKEVDKRIISPIFINEYTPNHTGVDPLIIEEDTPNHSGVDPVFLDDYKKEHIKNSIKEQVKVQKKNNKGEQESDFDALWKLYPRKQGNKKKAWESYKKAIKSGTTTYEEVLKGIEMYRKYIDYHSIAEEFIKHGSTWFNQECWSNDYTCKPKVIQGKRHGFLGLLLNEMEYEKSQSDVIDHEESINFGQETSGTTIGFASKSLPFGL